MNYQNYFPASYQQQYPQQPTNPTWYYQPTVNQPIMQQPQQPQAQQQIVNPQQQQQNQNQVQESYMKVNDESEARDYLIAPNTSILFIDAYKPYVYIKKMGISQLDRPIFEKYRLVKEDDNAPVVSNQTSQIEYITREEFEKRIAEIMDSNKSKITKASEKDAE